MTYARIAGVGSYLAERVVSNKDLEKVIDTSDEWIRDRTGIKRRHIAADDETTSSISGIAAERAMEAAGVGPDDIDLILVGTTTPDKVLPSTACIIQRKLGIKGIPAIDLQAVCSGFVLGSILPTDSSRPVARRLHWSLALKRSLGSSTGKIEARPHCSVMERAVRCYKLVTNPALSLRIYMQTASLRSYCTFAVECRRDTIRLGQVMPLSK